MMAYKFNNGPGILRLEARMSKFLLLKYLKPSLWALRRKTISDKKYDSIMKFELFWHHDKISSSSRNLKLA